MDWLASKEHPLFAILNGHPGGALPAAFATALLTVSRGGACWWAVAALVFLFGGRRGRRLAVTASLALALATVASWGLRGLVQRSVPALQYAGQVHTLAAFVPAFSFPSMRTAVAAAALPFFGRGSGARAGLVWLAAALIADAGVYAGAHLPSDVLAGALVGLLAARLAVWILGNPFRRPRGPLLPLSPLARTAAGPSSARRRVRGGDARRGVRPRPGSQAGTSTRRPLRPPATAHRPGRVGSPRRGPRPGTPPP